MERNKILLLIVALCAFAACTRTHSDRPTLSVSIEPQRKMLEALAGDRFDVVTVMANGANPETYDPSMSQRVAVDRSKALFITGFLPFEQALAQSAVNTRVVDTSVGIEPLTGTHSHGDEEHGHEVDPHVWTSVRNAMVMAKNMTDALIEIDPDNSEVYLDRYATMKARLDSLDSALAHQLAAAGAHAFVVWHPSLSYYARDYGLHQLSVGQESKELSLSALRDIISEAREDSVRVFFFQREFDSRQAESLNSEIGSRLITIDPLAYDWEAEISRITDELSK